MISREIPRERQDMKIPHHIKQFRRDNSKINHTRSWGPANTLLNESWCSRCVARSRSIEHNTARCVESHHETRDKLLVGVVTNEFV